MIKLLAKCLSFLAMGLVLSACHADLTSGDSGKFVNLSGPMDPARMKPIIAGWDFDSRMATSNKLEATLKLFGVRRRGRDFGTWISEIARSNSPLLYGLGGINGHNVLEVARRTLSRGNTFVDRPGVVAWGKIEDYFWDGNVGGNGYLVVTMYTRTTKGASTRPFTTGMRYRIEVTGGFRPEKKDANNPGNVFPDFYSNNGLAMSSITASGFNWKLWAVGRTIKVAKLWRNPNVDQAPNVWNEIPPNHPHYKHIFARSDEACIDIMFLDYPPMTFTNYTAGINYCLGRCKNPPVVNTN